MKHVMDGVPELNAQTAEQVETDIKYAGYLSREAVERNARGKWRRFKYPTIRTTTLRYLIGGCGTAAARPRPWVRQRDYRLTPAAIDLAILLARRRAG